MLQQYPPYSGYTGIGAGGGGGGAPVNAQYLVLALDGTLTDERVFTLAPRLAGTDGGAGGNYTVDLAVIVGVAGTYAYPSSVTVDTYGRVTAITAGAAPVASGWTDGGTAVYLTTSTDQVAIGTNTPTAQRSLTVQNINGSTLYGIRVTTDNIATENVFDTLSLNGVGPDDTVPRFAITGEGAQSWSSGAAAVDLRIRRSGVNTLTFDNGTTNGATLVPATDASGVFGTASLRWGDAIANTHRVFPSAGAVNASASLASGALKLGAGGATALDAQIVRNAVKTLQVDDNAGGAATLSVIGTTRTQTRAIAVSAVKTTAYVVAAADDVVLVDPTGGAFDVTLPNANVLTGRRVQVKRTTTSANAVTVKSGGGTIDNVAAATGIALAGGTLASISVVSDGANWWII